MVTKAVETHMTRMLDRLFEQVPAPTAPNIARESLAFWLAATIPGIVITAALVSLLPDLFSAQRASLPNLRELHHIIGSTTIGPLIETLGLGITIWVLRQVVGIDRKLLLVVLAAIIWAGLHSLVSVLWGLTVAWMFVVFAAAYVRWQPAGTKWAVLVATVAHALNNATAVLISALG
jgi:hypothetical protein